MSMLSIRLILLSFILPVFFISPFSFSASNTGKTILTKEIVGYSPYIESIAAMQWIVKPGNDPTALPPKRETAMGDVLFVPSKLCEAGADQAVQNTVFQTTLFPKNLFSFNDPDDDPCQIEAGSLTWYILDSGDQDWSTISSWDQLDTIEITTEQFPDALISLPSESLSGTDALVIPTEAIGKRIGFSFLPQTKTGKPAIGSRIYVWDLDYYFAQSPQSQAGKVIEDQGYRLEKTAHASGGGIVINNYPPKISDLVLLDHETNSRFDYANFLPGTKISAVYYYESVLNAADQSYFEWTQQDGSVIRSGKTLNGKVPEIEILTSYSGQSIELKVTAEDEREVIGNTLKQNTGEIYILPSVANLQIIYNDYENAPSSLNVGDMVSAKYDFIAGTSNIDHSRYEWKRTSDDYILLGGNVTDSGTIHNFRVTHAWVGSTFYLTLKARDGSYYEGNILRKEGVMVKDLPRIQNLQFFYHSTNSNQVPTQGIALGEKVSATYTFIGDAIQDRSTYGWRYVDGSTIRSGATENQTVPAITIEPELMGTTLTLTVYPFDSSGLAGDEPQSITLNTVPLKIPAIENLSLLYNNSPNVPPYIEYQSRLSARYTYKQGNDNIDASNYEWITDQGLVLQSGTIQQSGMIPDFTIPISGLGGVLTLNVTPKDGFDIEGKTESRQTIPIASAPKLEFIGFAYNTLDNAFPPQYGLEPNVTIAGRYRMKVEHGPLEDRTVHYWTYQNELNILQSGPTVHVTSSNNVGSTPFYNIRMSDVGKTLQLHLIPLLSNGAYADEQTYTTSQAVGRPPEILNLKFDDVQFNLFSKIYARYSFVGGNGNDRSRYTWRNSNSSAVLKSGTVSYTGEEVFYQPQDSDVGHFMIFDITPYDSNYRAGEPKQIRSVINVTSHSDNPYIQNIQLKTLSGAYPNVGETVYAEYEWYFSLYSQNSTALEKTTFDWFVDGVKRDYGFVSRGTSNAIYRDTRQNTTRGTYKITQNDMGKTLKIVMYAITDWRPRPGYDIQTLYGNKTEGTLLLDNTSPNIPPTITNLTISYSESGSNTPPAGGISSNGSLYANYSFIRGSDGLGDNSRYEWRHGFSNQIKFSGNINDVSNTIQPYKLSRDDVGQIILLTVTPISRGGSIGNQVQTQTPTVIVER